MRLLASTGLLSQADVAAGVEVPGVRFWPRGKDGAGAPTAFIPPLVGVGPDRVQAAMEAVAWQVAGAGSTVEVEPVQAIGLLIVRFRRAPAALPDVVPYPSGLRPTIDRLPVGVDVDGNTVSVRLRESNALVAGLPGGGKSGFLNAVIASAVGCGPSVALYGIDPKRVELAAWRGAFTRIATEDDDFLPLLNDLADEMNARYAYLAENGLRKFDTFDAGHPLVVLVIDEMAEVVSSADAKRDKAHAAAIRLLVQKGRAAGICVIGATQRPSSDVLPTSLRDLFVQRVAFATSTVEMSRMILGDGVRGDEPGPESIGANERGAGFVTSDGDRGLTRFKAYWVTDEAVRSVVDSLPASGAVML
jgi:DNA segregation ATPase FtsK/SpoIIIE-like protein